MIGQINDILQQNIAESGGEYQGVQLIEGPGGSARVMVGVQSYELGEVPDENIQALIRDAVATWEKTQ
jgi:NAD-specific glutamate dehydrogenase